MIAVLYPPAFALELLFLVMKLYSAQTLSLHALHFLNGRTGIVHFLGAGIKRQILRFAYTTHKLQD